MSNLNLLTENATFFHMYLFDDAKTNLALGFFKEIGWRDAYENSLKEGIGHYMTSGPRTPIYYFVGVDRKEWTDEQWIDCVQNDSILICFYYAMPPQVTQIIEAWVKENGLEEGFMAREIGCGPVKISIPALFGFSLVIT